METHAWVAGPFIKRSREVEKKSLLSMMLYLESHHREKQVFELFISESAFYIYEWGFVVMRHLSIDTRARGTRKVAT